MAFSSSPVVAFFKTLNANRYKEITYSKKVVTECFINQCTVGICYTSKNYLTVTSDEFLDMLIDKGCVFAWYFHYMPVGVNASTELLLTPEQRVYMHDKIREIRGITGGKEIFAIDFQNDGEFGR